MFHSLCDMVLPCSKLNNSNLIKGRNINICSFQKVHKHSLIQNELVSTFALKKISNYISFINHLYRNKEKKVTYVTLWGAYLFSKVHICDAKIAYLDDIANLEILPYGLHFSDVMSFTKIIRDVDG